MSKSAMERKMIAAFSTVIEHLPLQDGDIVVVKDGETWEAIGQILSRWKPERDVAFVLAPEGLEKVPRSDLETILKGPQRIILAE